MLNKIYEKRSALGVERDCFSRTMPPVLLTDEFGGAV